MQDGYHINVAINTPREAWNSTDTHRVYVSQHYCSIALGRITESEAREIYADMEARFPIGREIGEFNLRLTHWQSRGVELAVSQEA